MIFSRSVSRDVLTLLLLIGGGSFCGVVYNRKLIGEILSGKAQQAVSIAGSFSEGIRDVTLAETKNFFDQKTVLLVDARRDFFYHQERIPASICLPFTQFEKYWPDFEKKVPRDSPLVLYCTGYGCEDSHLLAKKLQDLGYRRLAVFFGGFPEWKQAGYPTESSPTPSR